MAGYTVIWNCEECDKRQETIDWPKHKLCDKHDYKTRLPCIACGHLTHITPGHIYNSGGRKAIHSECAHIDEEPRYIACLASPSFGKVQCRLNRGHIGAHKWWSKDDQLEWVPHNEKWRERA
jgi:hypothetical protein